MAHDPRHLANEFVNLGIEHSRPFTHLQIQKLVYFAHAWMLAFYNQLLSNELFEVWQHGPVSPSIYHNLSRFRARPIDEESPIRLHPEDERLFSSRERHNIDQIFTLYGEHSGPALSKWTHAPGTPWHQAKRKNRLYITNEDIKKYYVDLHNKSNGSRQRGS